MPLPRSVLTHSLPFSAMVLYALLLDRGSLSRKYGYTDESGRIYVVYPVLEAAQALGLSPTSVKKDMKKLEQAGLIRRIRKNRQEANRIFLLVPEDSLKAASGAAGRDGSGGSEGQSARSLRETGVAPNKQKKQTKIPTYLHDQEESL